MKLIVRTSSTFTWKMVSTADLISGLVARRSTRKVSSCRASCDSSLATRAFSVITGDLMMSHTVLIFSGRLLFRIRLLSHTAVALLVLRVSTGVPFPRLRVEQFRQLIDSRTREYYAVVIEQVIDVEAVAIDDLRSAHVPRREQQIVVLKRINDQRLVLREAQRRERL